MSAAEEGHVKVVAALLQASCDPDVVDYVSGIGDIFFPLTLMSQILFLTSMFNSVVSLGKCVRV